MPSFPQPQPQARPATPAKTECGTCFEEIDTSKTLACSRSTAHTVCPACVQRRVVDVLSKGGLDIDVKCMDMSGCGGTLSIQTVLKALGSEPALTKRYKLVLTERELRAQGYAVDECPFCEYGSKRRKRSPPEVKPWFQCKNAEEPNACGIVSCRMCKRRAHPGRTCVALEAA